MSPQRKIAFHSRAEEYASSSQYQGKYNKKIKNGGSRNYLITAVSYSSCRYVTFYHISDLRKSQKIKSRPKFLKDGDEESTISAQEGSEDHGPLRPFAPNTPNINDNQYPKENVPFTDPRDIRRSVGSNPTHSKSQKIPKEDHDPSNPLFFWYDTFDFYFLFL